MDTNTLWGTVMGAVAAAFGGFAVAVKWLNAQIADATAKLEQEIEELRARVDALESGNREARMRLYEARIEAVACGATKVAERILQVERLLG